MAPVLVLLKVAPSIDFVLGLKLEFVLLPPLLIACSPLLVSFVANLVVGANLLPPELVGGFHLNEASKL